MQVPLKLKVPFLADYIKTYEAMYYLAAGL